MKQARAALLVAVLVSVPVAIAAQRTPPDRTIAAGRASVLQLETGGAGVTMLPDAPNRAVTVHVDVSGSGPMPQVSSSAAGNRLVVTVGDVGGNSTLPFAAGTSTTLTVHYPAAMRLDVRLSSGNLHVVKPAAAVEVFDSDGDVSIDAPRGAVTVEAAHGNVGTTAATSTVDLAADTGNVTADVAAGWMGAEIRVQAAQGSIRLGLPRDFRGKLDLTAARGGVHNTFGRSNATTPRVWLYAPAGEIWVTRLP